MANRLEGQEISVTDSVADLDLTTAQLAYTLKNEGSDSVFFRWKKDQATLTGNAAALKALGCAEIKAGEHLKLPPPITHMEIVCATGLTATLRVIPGELGTSLNADVDIGDVHLLDAEGNDKINPAEIATDEVPAAAVSPVAAWNSVALPANTLEVHFNCDQDVYVVIADTDDDPSQNGCGYERGLAHSKTCKRSAGFLHYKRVSDDGVMTWTAFVD